MNFIGRGRPLSTVGMSRACATLAVEPAAIWAVLSVETSGFGFLADRRPQILFERHVFHRRTAGRYSTTHPDISNRIGGGYAAGAEEYARLDAALLLDHTAALESTSWGIGQVMGFNFARAGYSSVAALVSAMVQGEDAQLAAAAEFMKGRGLAVALQRRDWVAFARAYNGEDFLKNDYANRLARAHAKCCVAQPDLAYRAAQAALWYLGFKPGAVDGVPGPKTRGAVTDFQKRRRLRQTGELDSFTERVLLALAFS